MIILKISLNVIREKRLEMMQTLISMIEPRSKNAGCMSYVVLNDLSDKYRFCILGEWETREELDLHIESNQFGVLLGTKAFLSQPLDIQIQTVSHLDGMDYISMIRDRKILNISKKDGYGRF